MLFRSCRFRHLLILAGPGSGKTRVVVHRCAYLLRVKRVPAQAILVLCFNRNAVTELRRRLFDLAGDDAKGVTVQTYHGLSLRLTGHAMDAQNQSLEYFTELIKEAISLLKGEKTVLGFDADETRDRLLAGYRYILVDEYQDIDTEQYQLISAIAGRTLDDDNKLTILAVGDDDQNIYSFRGANISFIRQFKEDYQAREHYLVENYRSSAHIIAAANALIQHNKDRMKVAHPIRINQGRKPLPAGGRWQHTDTLVRGRVQIIRCASEQAQAQAVVEELLRLRQLDTQLDWTQCTVLATQWQLLNPVRALLEEHSIPFSLMLPADKQPSPFRIRENADLIAALKQSRKTVSTASFWLNYLRETYPDAKDNPWLEQLKDILLDWQKETNDGEVSTQQTLEFLYETLSEQRKERRLGRGVFLTTIHSVKGMEFSHLVILDGGWPTDSQEEQRRLLYVAMTRAKETLCLMQRKDAVNPFLKEIAGDFSLRRDASESLQANQSTVLRHYAILSLNDVDIGFAGQFSETNPIHQHLATLVPGSLLSMAIINGKVDLQHSEVTVARLSQKGHQEWVDSLARIETVKVIAMIKRYRDDSEESYLSRCQIEQWEIPMVELVYTQTTRLRK